jgi:hypothetical protein
MLPELPAGRTKLRSREAAHRRVYDYGDRNTRHKTRNADCIKNDHGGYDCYHCPDNRIRCDETAGDLVASVVLDDTQLSAKYTVGDRDVPGKSSKTLTCDLRPGRRSCSSTRNTVYSSTVAVRGEPKPVDPSTVVIDSCGGFTLQLEPESTTKGQTLTTVLRSMPGDCQEVRTKPVPRDSDDGVVQRGLRPDRVHRAAQGSPHGTVYRHRRPVPDRGGVGDRYRHAVTPRRGPLTQTA